MIFGVVPFYTDDYLLDFSIIYVSIIVIYLRFYIL